MNNVDITTLSAYIFRFCFVEECILPYLFGGGFGGIFILMWTDAHPIFIFRPALLIIIGAGSSFFKPFIN